MPTTDAQRLGGYEALDVQFLGFLAPAQLDGGVEVHRPVRILQGDVDPAVPAAHAVKVFAAVSGPDVTLTLIKGGDHRLSTPGNLALLRETVLRLAERSEGVSV